MKQLANVNFNLSDGRPEQPYEDMETRKQLKVPPAIRHTDEFEQIMKTLVVLWPHNNEMDFRKSIIDNKIISTENNFDNVVRQRQQQLQQLKE